MNTIIFKIIFFLSLFSLDEFLHLRKLEAIFSSTSLWQFIHRIKQNRYSKIKITNLLFPNLQILSVSHLDSSVWSIIRISSINKLKISECPLIQLYILLKSISTLKYLHIQHVIPSDLDNINTCFNEQYILHLNTLIIDKYNDKFDSFEIFLKQITNLKSLTISTDDNDDIIDAYRWQNLIKISLPKLNVFKFKFSYVVHPYYEDEFIEKFKQFQTDFWQIEHHWYTEYIKDYELVLIYTIPYISDIYEIRAENIRTCNTLINNKNNTFINVTDLSINYELMIENCQYYFSSVTSLILRQSDLTENDVENLKMIINLYNLKSIDIPYITNIKTSLLVEILKQSPKISSITINGYSIETIFQDDELCKYLNKMIKKLYQKHHFGSLINDYIKLKKFCEIFSNLEYLQCTIKNEKYLLFILNHLTNLSIAHITIYSENNSQENFLQFLDKISKRNIIVDRNDERCNRYDPPRYELDCWYKTKIFIWIGKH